MELERVCQHRGPAVLLVCRPGNAIVAIGTSGIQVNGMKANPSVGGPLQDECHPGVAQGQTCQSGISVIGDFELGRAGEMCNVLTTYDHGNINQSRFEQSINDFDGGVLAVTSITTIKSKSKMQSDMIYYA